jgi:hypothetical protein
MELAKYGPFNDRVDYYCKKAALLVMAGTDTVELGFAADNHAKRVIFSSAILKNQTNKVAYSIGVTTNAAVAQAIGTKASEVANADVTDGDLEYTVNHMFDAYSE